MHVEKEGGDAFEKSRNEHVEVDQRCDNRLVSYVVIS